MQHSNYRSGSARTTVQSVATVRLDWVKDNREYATGYAGMLGEVRVFTLAMVGNRWTVVTTLPGSPMGRKKEEFSFLSTAQKRAENTLRNWLTKAGIAAELVTNH